MSVRVIGFTELDTVQEGEMLINTTSRSETWSKGLSPFYVGPVEMTGLGTGIISKNVENAWQYSKVYPEHWDAKLKKPKVPEWTNWAMAGFRRDYANRYPMGKGAKPICSWWNKKKLDYVQARKQIYIPLYAQAVVKTEAFERLQQYYDLGYDIVLLDFDGYDHCEKDMDWKEVIECTNLRMGHAFVLAMMLEGAVKVL